MLESPEQGPLFWTKSGVEETDLSIAFFQMVMGSKSQDLEDEMFSRIWDFADEANASFSGSDSYVRCQDGERIGLQDLTYTEKVCEILEVRLFISKEVVIVE